jgi:predicted MFS family arabinose efflux permease
VKQSFLAIRHRQIRPYAIFFALTYFIQGLTDLASGFANQPIQFLLKEQLALPAAQTSFFFGVVGLGWTIKPFYGLLSDFFPLCGYQRKGYLLLMSAIGAVSWLILAVLPLQYASLLVFLTLCAATLAFCDVMTDALMVEVGRPLQLTGSFQALQWASISIAFTLAQFAGGYLSTHTTPQPVFLLSALFPMVTFFASLSLVREPGNRMRHRSLHDTQQALWQAAQSRSLWIVAGFLFFWNFSPSLGAPLLYYETDVLGFSKIFIGALGALGNIAGALGALIFFVSCRTLPVQKLLVIAIALGVVSTVSFVGLVGPVSAVLIIFVFGMLSQITHLAVLDLAARSCPVRAEGTVFALLMSCLNVGRTGSTVLGGWLYDHAGLTPLIVVSAGFTALCWLLVPLLRFSDHKEHERKTL